MLVWVYFALENGAVWRFEYGHISEVYKTYLLDVNELNLVTQLSNQRKMAYCAQWVSSVNDRKC